MIEQDRQISEIVAEERSRLRNFIRRRVPDPSDAEDIVQEVFYELVEANRLLMPIEHVTGWLFEFSYVFPADPLFSRFSAFPPPIPIPEFQPSNPQFGSRTPLRDALFASRMHLRDL